MTWRWKELKDLNFFLSSLEMLPNLNGETVLGARIWGWKRYLHISLFQKQCLVSPKDQEKILHMTCCWWYVFLIALFTLNESICNSCRAGVMEEQTGGNGPGSSGMLVGQRVWSHHVNAWDVYMYPMTAQAARGENYPQVFIGVIICLL